MYFGQFFIARSAPAAPDRWSRREHAGWHLAAHADLPVINLRARDGGALGWVIGHAVDTTGAFIRGDLRLPFDTPADFRSDVFERELYRHGGRYACAVLGPHVSRFYLDPGGTLATVYAPDRATVASTSSLIHFADAEAYAARKNAEPLVPANHFYPAGLTADPEVHRLLPSHCLDLNTWGAERHWQIEPIARASRDEIEPLIGRIVDRMRDTLRAATAGQPAYMGLTAGRDSRMVLAAARDVKERVGWVTFDYPDAEKHADVHMARKIARRFGLEHEVVPLTKPCLAEQQRYLHHIGYAGSHGKARDFDGACATYLRRDRAWLTGFGGEVGRAFYWRESDQPGVRLTTDELLSRMKMPRPDFRAPLDAWRRRTGVAHDPFKLLDLMYLEQRLGCWASVHGYGTAPFVAQLTPFNHRDVFDAVLRLPPEYRSGQHFAEAIIRRAWPELLELPYQQLTGVRKLAERVKKKLIHIQKRLMVGGRLKPPAAPLPATSGAAPTAPKRHVPRRAAA